MEKKEFDRQKSRNADIVSKLIAIEKNDENLSSNMEIATEKEFGNFISEKDKISARGRRSWNRRADQNGPMEEAKKEVRVELDKAIETFNSLNALAREYNLQGTGNEEDDFVLGTQKKAYELFEKLKNEPLNNEEFSDLIEYTKQMNFNEMIRNYVDMGRVITHDKIEKLEKESNKKVFVIFKPIKTKFRETFSVFKNQSVDEAFENPESKVEIVKQDIKQNFDQHMKWINDVNDNLFEILLEDDFSEIVNKEYSDEKLKDLLKETDSLKAQYDKINVSPNEDGFYSINTIGDRDNKWSEYVNSLINTIKTLQVMRLKNCYADIRKYAVTKTSSGTITCQIGDKYWPISKDNLVDDIAKFYEMKEEYEKKQELTEEKTKEEITVEEKTDIVDTPIIIDPETIEPEIVLPEEKEPLVENSIKEEVASPVVEIEVKPEIIEPEIVLPEENEQELSEEIKESEEETKVEEINQEPLVEDSIEEVVSPIVEIEAKPEVIEPETDVIETIIPSKQAYIEFMSCFVDRAEAQRLATEENVAQFEASNLGYNKYLEAVNAGQISKDATYEDFVVDRIQKDNGIIYDSDLVEELDNYKDDSGIDVIVADNNPTIIENVQSEPSLQPDLSGYDQMLSTSDPHLFTEAQPVSTGARRR